MPEFPGFKKCPQNITSHKNEAESQSEHN